MRKKQIRTLFVLIVLSLVITQRESHAGLFRGRGNNGTVNHGYTIATPSATRQVAAVEADPTPTMSTSPVRWTRQGLEYEVDGKWYQAADAYPAPREGVAVKESGEQTSYKKGDLIFTVKPSGTYVAKANGEPDPMVPNPRGVVMDKIQYRLIRLTNLERAKYQLKPYMPAKYLIDGSNRTSKWMDSVKMKEHPMSMYHPPGKPVVAENIAQMSPTPEGALAQWMNSPGHRSAILSPKYDYIGVGLYTDSTGWPYWTQQFQDAGFIDSLPQERPQADSLSQQ